MKARIYINASNIHSGGGRVLLVDLLNALIEKESDLHAIVYVDERFDAPELFTAKNLDIIKVKKKILERFKVDFKIKKQIAQNDLILHFGNIPPILNFSKNRSFLYLQNRLLIDEKGKGKFNIKLQLRLSLEQALLRFFAKNCSKVLVQTKTMLKLASRFGLARQHLQVCAFRKPISNREIADTNLDKTNVKLKKFIYIASNEIYKNHKNLLEAWILIADEGLRPELILNIDKSEALALVPRIKELDNIRFATISGRDEVQSLYRESEALIYPSYTESFGLPLLEAKDMGLDILASERDYVRDIVEPVETFDPDSAESIVGAVKRYHGIKSSGKVYTPEEFLEVLLSTSLPKKVLINVLSARLGGGITYIQKLADQNYIPNNIELDFIVNEKSLKYFDQLKNVNIVRSRLASFSLFTRLLWENFYLPFHAWRIRADYLICPAGIRPFLLFGNTKTVCISQNMLLFNSKQLKRFPLFTQIKFLLIKYLQIFSFKRADLIIFLSNFAKTEIEKYLDGKKGIVIHHGVSESFRRHDNDLNPIDSKYFLYVSHFYYYKSHIELLNTWERFVSHNNVEHKLVLIGFGNTPYGRLVKNHIADRKLENTVIFKDEIPQQELPNYYHGADLLVFASVCENCPNILIEGLSSGTPMASSNYDPMPEIAQDTVAYFDPYNEDSLYEIFVDFHSQKNVEKYKILAQKGIVRAQEFSWEKCMKKTWDSIQSID